MGSAADVRVSCTKLTEGIKWTGSAKSGPLNTVYFQGVEKEELDARYEVQPGALQLDECIGTGAFAVVSRLYPHQYRLYPRPIAFRAVSCLLFCWSGFMGYEVNRLLSPLRG